jgi:hypothetical protein
MVCIGNDCCVGSLFHDRSDPDVAEGKVRHLNIGLYHRVSSELNGKTKSA